MSYEQLPYNPQSVKSIIDYAKKLKNYSLRESINTGIAEPNVNYSNKGRFGQLLEEIYFKYKPNNDAQPDFPDVGLELKASPLKLLNNGEFRAKERLVLGIIEYESVINEEFENSSFWKKNAHLLLVFYLHEAEVDVLDLIIKLIDDWKYPEQDLQIIKQDWKLIQEKVKLGKAHELSEGDTFYLGACTKGATAESSYRNQPIGETKAKQRAFSLKQGYVNHIIANISRGEKDTFGKLIKKPKSLKKKSFEEYVIEMFKPYYGKNNFEIEKSLNVRLNHKAKGYYSSLTSRILKVLPNQPIQEFEKADVTVRTVRLRNGLPIEQISFPAFKYEEIINEYWESSTFREMLEKKFLFVFYTETASNYTLTKVCFWNMPFNDIEKCKDAWNDTVKTIKDGKIVQRISGTRRFTFFPGSTDNEVCHVRPHASNANDTYPLPIPDKLTGDSDYTKHSFWLNSKYVRDNIYDS